ncbi:CDP-glycerol glycerophosphotransferase family protein [Butyrivibrio sp. MC2013]|uniref:CDP-glycerol glycerophosphotransferase family protein n=1 Tax=Butyrivibrio sp. MC2013 TaxID=1280686 RepID=UPI000401D066|nr:CDP-glycerol glycerophosphotransferase family protein [Butyrivibrio sp. MC2013]
MNMINKISRIPGFVIAYIRLCLAWIVVHSVCRKLLDQEIWLIGEKKNEARDNGYHFMNYMMREHPDVSAYYIIVKGSPDVSRLPGDRIIYYMSFKHLLYYVAAKYCVGGQLHANKPYASYYRLRNRFVRHDQKTIFIGHGIKKDDLDNHYDYRKSGYSLMTTGARPEYEHYKARYSIPDDKIALTGLCRYDKLYRTMKTSCTEKIILIMPTFRSWLRTSDSMKKRASAEEEQTFLKSEYYSAFMSLLNDKRMTQWARDNGYKIIFYLHFSFQPYAYLFEENLEADIKDIVIVAKRSEYDVQDLLIRSSFLITDYSSVFFDFAYMHKPVVYYQFDATEFRKKHYKEGYFSYKRDGFGPVYDRSEDVVDYCLDRMNDGSHVDTNYAAKIDGFFLTPDDRNCQRVYEAIRNL